MKTPKNTNTAFTVSTSQEVHDMVKSEANKEDRPKSKMGAILIAEALAHRHNNTMNISNNTIANHG
ncbi:hypothetical protein WN093_04625 [Gammaproteobacteria bacterium AS21]